MRDEIFQEPIYNEYLQDIDSSQRIRHDTYVDDNKTSSQTLAPPAHSLSTGKSFYS